jgi:hypothetical protein
MSSKSPVRSCEDVDQTALSFAEIKALCAGNPLIAEKMTLDNEVAQLRMLKSEYQSQRYRLEDDLLKRFPEQIISVTERIEGIEKDIAKYAAEKEKCVNIQMNGAGGATASSKFPGITVGGVFYGEKEPAAKALLESCKGVKGRLTDTPVGEYMGFKMYLRYERFSQQINLLLRGAITYQIDLGTDAHGNFTRINNALDKMPERLADAKSQLENLNKQAEAAKLELAKPFEQESELQEKEARLTLLNTELNIDGDGGLDVMNDPENRDTPDVDGSGDEPDSDGGGEYEPDYEAVCETPSNYAYSSESIPQTAPAKSKPSILDGIRNFDSSMHNGVQGKDKPTEHAI